MPQKTLITAFLPLSATVGSFGQNFAHTTNEVGHHGDTITFHLLQIHLRMSSVPWVNKKFPVNEPFANWKSRFFIGKSIINWAVFYSYVSLPKGIQETLGIKIIKTLKRCAYPKKYSTKLWTKLKKMKMLPNFWGYTFSTWSIEIVSRKDRIQRKMSNKLTNHCEGCR